MPFLFVYMAGISVSFSFRLYINILKSILLRSLGRDSPLDSTNALIAHAATFLADGWGNLTLGRKTHNVINGNLMLQHSSERYRSYKVFVGAICKSLASSSASEDLPSETP